MPSKADGTLTAEIAQLGGLDLGKLRDLWRQRLGSPPHFASTGVTRLWLAWELQARARGSNENTNGLVRQYFPTGTDFARISQAHLNAIALRLNQRPRKTLGFETPADKLQTVLH